VTRSVLIISHKWDWVLEYLGYVAIFLPPILFGLWLMWVGWSRRWDLVGVLLVTTGAIYTMGVWAISAKPDR
jgi:hypothetical protein